MKGKRVPSLDWSEVQANPFRAFTKLRARVSSAAADPRRVAGFLLTPAELHLLAQFLEDAQDRKLHEPTP